MGMSRMDETQAKAEARAEYLAWEIETFGKHRTSKTVADKPLCECGRPIGRNGKHCRECHRREYSKSYYAENVDAVKQRAATWRAENRERRNDWERKRYHQQHRQLVGAEAQN